MLLNSPPLLQSPSASISSFASSKSGGESSGGRGVPLSNNNSLPKEVSVAELELLKKLEEQNRSAQTSANKGGNSTDFVGARIGPSFDPSVKLIR